MTHGLGINHIKLHLAILDVRLERIAKHELCGPQVRGQHVVVQVQQFTQLGCKTLWVLQVLYAQCTTRDLVFVCRTDATTGGTDLLCSALLPGRLARHIDGSVKGQDQRARFTDPQARTHLDTGFLQAFNFFEQLCCGQHYAITDVALDPWAHDAAGDQMQSRLDAIDHQCVASVMPPLEAHYALSTFRQPIDQLTFAFVAPLGTDHHYVATFGCFHLKPNSNDNCSNSLHDPTARNLNQFTIAVEFIHFALVPRQNTHDRFTGSPKLRDRCIHIRSLTPRSTNRGLQGTGRHHTHHLLDIQTEPGRRAIPAKDCTDLIVSTAAHQGIAGAWGVDRKTRTAVIGVSAQISQVEGDRRPFKTRGQPLQI